MTDLIRNVEAFIEEGSLLRTGHLFVGVSGGCDSMALLYVLNDIRNRKYPGMAITAVHVHHGIRGAEADEDEKMVASFCEKLGVPLKAVHLDIPALAKENHRSLETEGRIRRYELFDELCGCGRTAGEDQASGACEDAGIAGGDAEAVAVVAVAHHMEDQAESIAMHLFRGCGMEGLIGMKPKSGNIIRPFLKLRKAEILAFCEENHIPYHNDSTNGDSRYGRNFFRNEVFPLVDRGIHGSPVEALCGLSSRIADENDYLDETAAKALDQMQGAAFAPNEAPAAEILRHPLKLRILKLLAKRAFGDVVDMEECHWESILTMMKNNEGNKRLDLPLQRTAILEHGVLKFTEKTVESAFGAEGEVPGVGFLVREEDVGRELPLTSIPCGKMINFFQSLTKIRLVSIEKEAEVVYNNTTWFFSESIMGRAVLRTRKEGDTVCRAGTSLTKELRRFMNDEHIPADVRDRLLLVADGNRILWVPGHLHAEGFTDRISREKYLASETSGVSKSDGSSGISWEGEDGKLYGLTLFSDQ